MKKIISILFIIITLFLFSGCEVTVKSGPDATGEGLTHGYKVYKEYANDHEFVGPNEELEPLIVAKDQILKMDHVIVLEKVVSPENDLWVVVRSFDSGKLTGDVYATKPLKKGIYTNITLGVSKENEDISHLVATFHSSTDNPTLFENEDSILKDPIKLFGATPYVSEPFRVDATKKRRYD